MSSRAVRQARHSQNTWAQHVERVESSQDVTLRDEPSGIWASWNNCVVGEFNSQPLRCLA